MADSHTVPHLLNPWVLHLQKLGLELKCPFCLNLYNKPLLLPCNHIFCSSCVPKSNLIGSECLLCKLPYVEQELRPAPYMENVVNIFRNLEASFSKHVLNSDIERVSEQRLYSTKTNPADQLAKQTIGPFSHGNSISEPFRIPLMGTKRVQVSNASPGMTMLEKGGQFVHKDFQPLGSNPSSIIHPHQTRATQQEHEAVAEEMNQVELSPDCSLSCGVNKGVEVGSIDEVVIFHKAEKCPPNMSAKRNVDDFGVQGIKECNHLNLKKQKQMHQGLPDVHDFSPPSINNLQNSISPDLDMDPKTRISRSNQVAVEVDSTSLVNFTCAFCQTWKITEGSGPMQHFANGKQVFEIDAGRSNVIHVHKSCIEWAPQIFYVDDTTVKNLGKELARSAKLKCACCGLKGAALGCYAKSCRRSYHVTCAYGIAKCRWDSDEFLMLCPSHSSYKFPNEKFKNPGPKKFTTSAEIYDGQESANEDDFWSSSPSGAKNWILCASALSADEKLMLVKFAKLCGATVAKSWGPNVTHVIAATNANGACTRTLKVLMGILYGRWILSIDWIRKCMESKSLVDEEPYEISLDNHGYCDGPKTGRLKALTNAPLLFSGLKFYFTGYFVLTYKRDIQSLIRVAGGTVVDSTGYLYSVIQPSSPTSFVIYNNDAMMGEEDACGVSERRAEAERLAIETGSQVIAHTWILDSISSSVLQPFS